MINHIHLFLNSHFEIKTNILNCSETLQSNLYSFFFSTHTSKASDYFCVSLSTVKSIFLLRVKSGGEYYPLKVHIRDFTLIRTYSFVFTFLVSSHNRLEGSSAYTEVQSQTWTFFLSVPSCTKVIIIIIIIRIYFLQEYLSFFGNKIKT